MDMTKRIKPEMLDKLRFELTGELDRPMEPIRWRGKKGHRELSCIVCLNREATHIRTLIDEPVRFKLPVCGVCGGFNDIVLREIIE